MHQNMDLPIPLWLLVESTSGKQHIFIIYHNMSYHIISYHNKYQFNISYYMILCHVMLYHIYYIYIPSFTNTSWVGVWTQHLLRFDLRGANTHIHSTGMWLICLEEKGTVYVLEWYISTTPNVLGDSCGPLCFPQLIIQVGGFNPVEKY